jgi:hypothetical protein
MCDDNTALTFTCSFPVPLLILLCIVITCSDLNWVNSSWTDGLKLKGWDRNAKNRPYTHQILITCIWSTGRFDWPILSVNGIWTDKTCSRKWEMSRKMVCFVCFEMFHFCDVELVPLCRHFIFIMFWYIILTFKRGFMV